MDLTSIFTVILLASASALCIALIFYLSQITKAIRGIEAQVEQISDELKPFISSTKELSERLNEITDEAKGQLATTRNIVTKVDDRVDTILELEEKIRGGFEGNVLSILKSLSAIANGITAFWSAFKRT